MKLEFLEAFLESGVDKNARNLKGEPLIHILGERVKKTSRSIHQETKEKIIQVVLKHGIDIFAKNSEGENVLHFLIRKNSIAFVRSFFEHISKEDKEKLLGAENNKKETSLSLYISI